MNDDGQGQICSRSNKTWQEFMALRLPNLTNDLTNVEDKNIVWSDPRQKKERLQIS